ncbi:MAG: SH3 domain-containing protein [Candidatus Omnitrophica bacterium]|nr:SH3 domain-containing protein [Candidatus Omnitrophota bacterium]
MKRIILFIFSFIILFSLSAVYAQSNQEDTHFPFIGRIKAERVNVRSGPHLNFETLGKVKKGQDITVVGEKQDWYKVRVPSNFSVFVDYKFVQKRTEPVGVVKGKRVNVRAKPNLKATLLGQLNKGEIVTIRGQNNEWLKIAPTPNCFAWIKAEFVNYIRAGLAKEPADEIELVKKPEPKVEKASSGCKKCGQKRKETPTAKGIVEDSGRLLNKRSLAKLIDKNNEIEYFLDADKKLLDTYGNSRVAVWGEVIKDKDYPAPIIKVEKIILLE